MLEPIEGDLTRLLQELVRADTVAIPPDGNENAGQVVLEEFLRAHGVECESYDTGFLAESDHPCRRLDRHYAGRKNLIARVPGTGRGRRLLFNGHMDTVPPGRDPWTDGPWSGAIRNGRLYGRGSFDMKGGLAAQFGVACALRKAGVRLGGDVLCESVVDEEWGGGGGTLAARLRGDNADACVIPEGTQLVVALATRGGVVVDLVCEAGDPTAYFSTDEVVSPAIPVGRLLGWVDGWVERRRQIPRGEAYASFPDPAPVQVLAVEANTTARELPYSVPLTATVRMYFQFLPYEEPVEVMTEVRASLDRFCADDPFFRVYPPQWKPAFDPPLKGHELAPTHPWSRCFIECATESLGRRPEVTAAPYPCDAFLAHREFGIPTLLFGPCGGGAHNADEYVEIRSMFDTAASLLTSALVWCA